MAGETTTPQRLYPVIEEIVPDAVMVEGKKDWLEAVYTLAPVRKNIMFFVAGEFGMSEWREIRKTGCVAVSSDPGQAAKEVAAATEGISSMFQFDNRPEPKEFETKRVDLVRSGLVIAVFGIKGGIGKTEIALNLAAAVALWAKNLSRDHGQEYKVLLLDYNSDYGTSKVNLGLYSRVLNPNAPKVYSVGDMDDPSLVRGDDFISRLNYYKKANLYFLAPPQTPDERLGFNKDLAAKILNMASAHFDLVVVDLGTALDKRDPAMVALEAAKKLLFVVEPLHTVVATNAEFTQVEMRTIVDMSKVSLVINRAHAPNKAKQVYTPTEASRSLGIPYLASLPYEPKINEGVPHVCVDQRCPFSRAIEGLAKSVVGSSSVGIAPPKKRFFIF